MAGYWLKSDFLRLRYATAGVSLCTVCLCKVTLSNLSKHVMMRANHVRQDLGINSVHGNQFQESV